MASGDHSTAVAVAPENLPMGSVITSSGRISGVHRVGEPFVDDLPFTTKDLVALDVQAVGRAHVCRDHAVGCHADLEVPA